LKIKRDYLKLSETALTAMSSQVKCWIRVFCWPFACHVEDISNDANVTCSDCSASYMRNHWKCL